MPVGAELFILIHILSVFIYAQIPGRLARKRGLAEISVKDISIVSWLSLLVPLVPSFIALIIVLSKGASARGFEVIIRNTDEVAVKCNTGTLPVTSDTRIKSDSAYPKRERLYARSIVWAHIFGSYAALGILLITLAWRSELNVSVILLFCAAPFYLPFSLLSDVFAGWFNTTDVVLIAVYSLVGTLCYIICQYLFRKGSNKGTRGRSFFQ